MNVGIIGVGLMGHGIARNVLKRGGFKLWFLEHPGNQPTDELLELGATPCSTTAAVAAATDLMILCVTGSPQVEAVLTEPDGVLSAMRAGTVVVDCSTSLPGSTERMAALVAEAGGFFLDAPMTRTAQHAHEGTLNLLVGGTAEALLKAQPVLDSFTADVRHVGGTGTGHRLKLLHNYVSIGFISLLAEAAAEAENGGVDPKIFVDVLASGGGGGVALDRMAPFLTEQDRNSLPFALSNAQKDIDYYRAMASEAGSGCRIADGVSDAISHGLSVAEQAGEAETILPELARLLRRNDNSR
ncbi:NAD(P)-dependent oxidoreductase [Hoeflea prorocentri]|uniref:NAD(P)-dependent oxidoreductase n=1 Tax=Hoeflea prorocentri TaxID=1922333 RepID=A0A9X3ULN5_9HYPH|nr:NAD(P)-dependent oxidoreductase [Hoeflea prorocentri]MCY6382700.1 NAD(P)-dependent oxidoreductase [Hoeflea prorocentri]MDA5400500.1 NAD(P)-dependent oxidoreductase [Hoeflea prorocentri]